jgi:thiol-disulfide isomerase/thioredoxin
MQLPGIIFLLATIISLHTCAAQGTVPTGKTDVKEVENNYSWFSEGYNLYIPDSTDIKALTKEGATTTYIVFAGTWCGDTKRELPRFYKITDQANIPKEKITLYLLDQSKKSPQKLEKKYKVHSIPTFIILENGKEKGRIVESPQSTLEKDLLEILK